MTEDTSLLSDPPVLRHKKVIGELGDDLIRSEGGVVLFPTAECRLGLSLMLAGCFRKRCELALSVYSFFGVAAASNVRGACGYKNANDWDTSHTYPHQCDYEPGFPAWNLPSPLSVVQNGPTCNSPSNDAHLRAHPDD